MRRLEWPHGLVVLAAAAAAFFAIVVGQARAALPDGRGYELVSPPNTNENSVFGTTMSPDGLRVGISYQGGVPGSSSGGYSLLVSQRSASGWQVSSLLPPADQLVDTQYTASASTPDLTRFIAVATHGYPNPRAPIKLVRLDADGSQTVLHQFDTSVTASPLVAVSDDLSHVLTNVPEQIDPDHQPGTWNVYDFGSGTPVLVSRLPDGSVPACGVAQNGAQSFVIASSAPSQHWVSADGTRAFFHTRGNSCGSPPELYMRDLQAGTTTLISGPVLSGTDGGATFVRASGDGSQVYFTTTSQLDPADTNTTRDIYRYTVGVGNECLTCGVPSANVTNPSGSDFPVVNSDGSRIYFTTTSALTGDDTDGAKSVYLLENGTISYVAPTLGINFTSRQGGASTPDGRVLVFRGNQADLNTLTGSDNGGHVQYYRYDDGDHSLTCISCPSGGPATFDVPQGMSNLASFSGPSAPPIMSGDGSVIVFKTRDALVPQDDNHDEDLYEWHNGAVGLITDGVTPYTQLNGQTRTGSSLIGVSTDGTDIVFESFSALTPDVIDTGQPPYQVYDARIGGGFPQPTPPAQCDGDQCHGALSGPPSLAGVGSATYSGSGNVVPPPVVRLTLARVTAAQRRAFARHGTLTLRVGSNTAGALGASATARVGGRTRAVAHASQRVAAGGRATLVLRLSAAARRPLAHGHGLRVTVTVHLAGTSATRRLVLSLRPTATANGR